MGPDARVAVYYAPRPDDVLFADAAAWLGRDPASGATVRQPDIANLAEVTAEPRHYGFHATLKPLADRIAPFNLPALSVQDVFGFLALRETAPSPPLQALADVCVEQLDPFRAPPSEAELARRRRGHLSPRQDAMLLRWGYPYVFDTWFFHLTLTRRLSAAEKHRMMPTAETYFARAIAAPRRVTDICLFVQPGPDTPFAIQERLMLGGSDIGIIK